jgi:predicted dehydrogenase
MTYADTDVVRFAVVGVKGYSHSHLEMVQALAQEGLGRLAASMMIDRADHPDMVAEFEASEVRVFDDYANMLDLCPGDVDIVTLPVPIHLHAPMATAALQAGYHVLVEKPLAGSLDEADEIIAARDASGKQCAVGFQQIYSPLYQTLKQYVVEGMLGRVHRIAIAALWPRPPRYYARNDWAGKLFSDERPVYDSPFNNALAHQIMNMLYLASPEPNQAATVAKIEAELYRAYDIESFDTGCMRAYTTDGVEIVFAAAHACDVNVDPVMRLEAERAHVDWRIGGDATISHANGHTEIVPEDVPRMHMIRNVADMVTGAVPAPRCTPEIARAHTACIEALHQATPIETVADQFVSEIENGQRVIAGIHDAVRQVLETGKLFSELDAAFARAP